ncbi:hypothetical protein EWM64_g8187 [Hericium alpestre]|uniref:Uncharacterized protein n=1 Tax=Hericium alpestre TaxID=135208 RepID=A0A4Y9ZMG9_9AGAM|nr:hypothetical protein EWM64_g8187 [Hericium alpestre]
MLPTSAPSALRTPGTLPSEMAYISKDLLFRAVHALQDSQDSQVSQAGNVQPRPSESSSNGNGPGTISTASSTPMSRLGRRQQRTTQVTSDDGSKRAESDKQHSDLYWSFIQMERDARTDNTNGRALYEAALEALEGPPIDLDLDTQTIVASTGSNTSAPYGLSRASSTRSSRSSVLRDPALAFKEKNNKNSPWNKARAAMPWVLRQGLVKRCAITLADAYTEFQAGEKKMALLKPDGSQLGMQGEMGAIQCFSNAFLKDSHVICLTTPECENFYLQSLIVSLTSN